MVKKSKRQNVAREDRDKQATGSLMVRMNRLADRISVWYPYVLAIVYTLILGALTFHYHTVGEFGVETDFYGELVPQAQKLLAGDFTPENYSAKGPVYSILLSVVFLIVRDYFRAGLVLNFLAAAVFIIAVFHLLRRLFGSLTALIATTAVSFNFMFMSYTYQAASDLPFMMLCVLSMLFLFREGGRRDIIVSAVFGLLAFLTRYNGAFVPMGSLVFLMLTGGGNLRDRLRRSGLWLGVFVLCGLPWFVSNWIVMGSPVKNANHVNVALEYYAIGKKVSYENWTDVLPEDFNSIGEIVMYDPGHFIRHTAYNVYLHFLGDMRELLGLRTGVFVMAGMLAFFIAGFDRRRLLYLLFGILYFMILTIVFYNPRFSLFLLIIYMPFAIHPFVSGRFTAKFGTFSLVPVSLFVLVTLTVGVASSRGVYDLLQSQPPILEDIRETGLTLRKIEADTSKAVYARKPHVAYYARLRHYMFPNDVQSVDDLVKRCRDNGVEYVYYGAVEAHYRPEVGQLYSASYSHPDVERLFFSDYGAVYRIRGVTR